MSGDSDSDVHSPPVIEVEIHSAEKNAEECSEDLNKIKTDLAFARIEEDIHDFCLVQEHEEVLPEEQLRLSSPQVADASNGEICILHKARTSSMKEELEESTETSRIDLDLHDFVQDSSQYASPLPTPGGVADVVWNTMLQQLKDFKEICGHCNVPLDCPEALQLGEWCEEQRALFTNCSTAEVLNEVEVRRKAALDELGFSWVATPNQRRANMSIRIATPADHVVTPDGDRNSRKGFSKSNDVVNTLCEDEPEGDKWQCMYEELRVYKKKHGHCIVPTVYPENKQLAAFVSALRRAFRKNACGRNNFLSQEKIDALDALGFAWEVKRGRKRKSLCSSDIGPAAKLSRAPHGFEEDMMESDQFKSTSSPAHTKDEVATLAVVGSEASYVEHGVLTKKKSTTFSTKNGAWSAMLKQLEAYKHENGDCLVPRAYRNNPQLGEWCKTQRRTYKNRLDGKPGPMTVERINALEALGFCWVLGSRRKEQNCELLKAKQTKQGNDNAEECPEKRDNTVPFKGEKCNSATTSKEYEVPKSPRSVGSKYEAKWQAMVDQLREYKSLHGDCMVPRGYKENPQLAEWCKTQRRAYRDRRGTRAMTKERQRVLENMGFSWVGIRGRKEQNNKTRKERKSEEEVPFGDGGDGSSVDANVVDELMCEDILCEKSPIKEDGCFNTTMDACGNKRDLQWQAMFEELKRYKAKHGDCHVPNVYKDSTKLSAWCKTQRRTYKALQEGKSNYMTEARLRALESIGFCWSRSTNQDTKREREIAPPSLTEISIDFDLVDPVSAIYDIPHQHDVVTAGHESKTSADTKSERKIDEKRVHLDNDRWNVMFRHLKEYKEKHGDCLVPRSYKAHPQLGEWVKTQRRKYKLHRQGRSKAMDQSRVEALEAVGFKWVVKGKA